MATNTRVSPPVGGWPKAPREDLGVQCPECHGVQTYVVDTRSMYGYTRRRLECKRCGCRFATHEMPVEIIKAGYKSSWKLLPMPDENEAPVLPEPVRRKALTAPQAAPRMSKAEKIALLKSRVQARKGGHA